MKKTNEEAGHIIFAHRQELSNGLSGMGAIAGLVKDALEYRNRNGEYPEGLNDYRVEALLNAVDVLGDAVHSRLVFAFGEGFEE